MSRPKRYQAGFVSIFSVMIIMTVLTLIAVGFSALARQAERRTLDNQLNTQAFYAAESGINDAMRVVNATSATGNPNKTQCQGTTADGRNLPAYTYDTGLNVGYTCVLIDSKPPIYKVDSVPVEAAGEAVVLPFTTTSAPDYLEVSFDSRDLTNDVPDTTAGFSVVAAGNPVLPTAATWGTRVGVLRLDFVPATTLDRNALVGNAFTLLMYPYTSNNLPATPPAVMSSMTVSPAVASKGVTMPVLCGNAANSAGYRCRGRIDMVGNTALKYVLRAQSFYNPVKMEFSAFTAAGVKLPMSDGMVVVDSTGRANDVFRRIQEYRPLNPIAGQHQSLAVQSADSICKRSIFSSTVTDYDGTLPGNICNPSTY